MSPKSRASSSSLRRKRTVSVAGVFARNFPKPGQQEPPGSARSSHRLSAKGSYRSLSRPTRQVRGRKELAHRLQNQAISGQHDRGQDGGFSFVTKTKGNKSKRANNHQGLNMGWEEPRNLIPKSRDELFNGLSKSLHSMSKEINAAAAASLLNVKIGLDSQFSREIAAHQAKISTFLDKRAALMELQTASEEGSNTTKDGARRAIAARSNVERTLRNLSRQRDSLDKLFHDWDKVQQKILCLAIETLGPSCPSAPEIMAAADVMKSNTRASFEPRLHDAIAAFELRCEEEQGKDDPGEKCMKEVQTVCQEAMTQAQTSAKKSREEKRKQRQEVYSLAQKMLVGM